MKNVSIKKILGLLTLGLIATGAQANWEPGQSRHGHGLHESRQSRMFSQHINARQDRQMARIHAGMRDGRLTRFEFRELMHEQRRIAAMERHFRADGDLDAREYRRLDHALDMTSRRIWAEKHDRQERYAYSDAPWSR